MRERRKSKVEEALATVGLGGVASSIAKVRSKSRGRGRDSSSDRDSRSDRSGSRGRGKGYDSKEKWQQAAKAAVLAGAAEAFQARNVPGKWTGEKGQRIATAALAAAGIDGFLDRNPNEKSKRHILESVVGGLAANRLANGPTDRSRSGSRGRSESRSRSRGAGRSRSRFSLRSLSRRRRGSDDEDEERGGRSKSRGPGLKGLVAAGGVAAAGKAIYDRVRSKSRRRRSPSQDSEDSYVPSRRQAYQRDRGGPDNNGADDDRVAQRGRAEGGGDENRDRDGSSSSASTTDLENQKKKTRGKELLTAGLAAVATIHAAHGVYSSMKASEARHKLVAEGEMSPEEARKRKSKNMLQDAAAVGIAALGIKSAYGEWKEMNEQRHEVHRLEDKHRKARKHRAEKEQQRKENGGMNGGANNYGSVAYPPQQQQYADGNPYSNVSPPPMRYR